MKISYIEFNGKMHKIIKSGKIRFLSIENED